MKSTHLIFLSIYVICIICGFGVGKALKQAEPADMKLPSEYPTPQSIPTLKNGQHSLLIIAVDNLDLLQPRLNSVWLVTYFINNPSITFLPISPTLSNGKVIVDEKLFNSFEIIRGNGQINIAASFFDTLTLRNFWWGGYLIVDQQAFSSLLENSNNMSPNDSAAKDSKSHDNLTEIGQNSEAIYQEYNQAFHDTCQLIAQQGENFNWQSFSSLIPHHIKTDLDAGLMINEWASLLSSIETPLCSFPLDSHTPEEIN